VTARCTVVSTETSTHGPHYKTVLLLPVMTMPLSGLLASLANFARVEERQAMDCRLSASGVSGVTDVRAEPSPGRTHG
jgi:hypothetical protein